MTAALRKYYYVICLHFKCILTIFTLILILELFLQKKIGSELRVFLKTTL